MPEPRPAVPVPAPGAGGKLVTRRELMVARAAGEIGDGDVVFVGMRLPPVTEPPGRETLETLRRLDPDRVWTGDG